jgi:hypothetical protein
VCGPGQDPYYTHFCRADLDGGDSDAATDRPDRGERHPRGAVEAGDAYFVDTYSRVALAAVTELRP